MENVNWTQSEDIQINLRFIAANYRIQIYSIWVRHGYGATDRDWYRLPRWWNNWFVYEAYEGGVHETNIGIYVSIGGDSINNTFDIKLVSVLGEEIICNEMGLIPFVQYQILECLNQYNEPQQFMDIGDFTESEYELSCRDTIAPTSNQDSRKGLKYETF